jgi:parallel beta-helix repeat protein
LSKKITTGIALLIFASTIVTSFFHIQPVKARTIIVPNDYPTIQDAINAAEEGDTIFVRGGTYYGQVVINKSLTILGGNHAAIVDGTGAQSTFCITSDAVQLGGFTIKNLAYGQYPYGYAVYLLNSNRSTIMDNQISDIATGIYSVISYNVTMKNNTISRASSEGILIYVSSDSTISDNTFSRNYWGIRASNLDNGTICSNSVFQNVCGIELSNCENTVIDSNDVEFGQALLKGCGVGIDLINAKNCTLHNNTMANNDYNFGVEGTQMKHFVHNIDSSNTVGGKPICYYVGRSNLEVPINAGYVAAVNCANIRVQGVAVRNNFQGVLFVSTTDSIIQGITAEVNRNGVYLLESTRNTIIGNRITHMTDWYKFGPAVYLNRSDYNSIRSNELDGNLVGMSLNHSSCNLLTDNTIANSEETGLSIRHSENNTIYHNNFINNAGGTLAYYSVSLWDNGYPSGGNYWSNYSGADAYRGPYQNETGSDGIGDVPYVVASNNTDRYPLMNPWTPMGGPDINEDGKVDLQDLVILAQAYGSKPGEQKWNAKADIDHDNVVGLSDLTILARYYGQHYP